MIDPAWLSEHSQLSLKRLLPGLTAWFASQLSAADWDSFTGRLEKHFSRLFELLVGLYGEHYDFFFHLENILATAAGSWVQRAPDLKTLDAGREADPGWYQSNQMLGGVCYVDLFAGNLTGLTEKIPYFKELGLTYLHLMPLFKCPEGNSDGGYAVSSYRDVNPALGTMAELRQLAADLRRNGISLVLDFIFNHTSNEHDWAQRARAGDREYQGYYLIFPDRQLPDAYERYLREIFPDEHPGAFSPFPGPVRNASSTGSTAGAWVWTTFHDFQWDLNYANPALFTAMAEELLFIANVGVEVLRLDAVAFIWKQLGTVCENLPQAHEIIQAFNTLARIAAPALLFKSEAIVHPDEVAKYIRLDECQLSYNPLLMALLWNSLATRKTRLLAQAMQSRFAVDPGCAWVNYVRVHDDIGWTFSDEDAAHLGVNGYDHRRFLNNFYTGRYPGSFARGVPFQENPKTGDCRVSGTGASLAGLEKAVSEESGREVDLAINRILLLYGIIFTVGGVPLIYLGDEIGTLNDDAYQNDPAKADDSRWDHRPFANWATYARRSDSKTIEGRIYAGFQKLIAIRKQVPAVAGGRPQVLALDNDRVLGFLKSSPHQNALILANFSEQAQSVALQRWLGAGPVNLVTGQPLAESTLSLQPYEFAVIV